LIQHEDDHIKKWRWSVYALDVACVRWKSFTVYTPSIKNIYVIEHIWYDNRLGNYIILKHWELRFVYWHTITDLKVGTALKNGQGLWVINKSWMSENYHLHIELWKWYDNISWKYTKWEWLYINQKSFDIRNQRWLLTDKEVNDQVFTFISKYEGCHLESYFDINHWSIGYWSNSYQWEKITQDEAIKRLRVRIQSIRTNNKLTNHPVNVQVWVVSFIYNIGSIDNDQKWLLSNKYYKALSNDFKRYVNAGWVKLNWLVTRRTNEYNLINNL